ncbi:hypothetical protein UVI_02014560 [Ustilaginoidea virens]|uniref:Uncharacterized protein n=1 Tax=Ustilaginoidea virens TaxID=1159556 RepID=A0A1B5L7N8_USTVR|nr:hypothetical protein UVI_02014560 [Ustilaginoidea virens]
MGRVSRGQKVLKEQGGPSELKMKLRVLQATTMQAQVSDSQGEGEWRLKDGLNRLDSAVLCKRHVSLTVTVTAKAGGKHELKKAWPWCAREALFGGLVPNATQRNATSRLGNSGERAEKDPSRVRSNRRIVETSNRRNVETSKRRNVETSKRWENLENCEKVQKGWWMMNG